MKTPEDARFVPYDISVEQEILGAMLLYQKNIDTAAADLTAEHFYDPVHARLFDMVVYLSTEGPITPMIVNAVMKSDPGLLEVGGIQYLANLAAACPAMPNVARLAKIIIELAQRRDLIRIGEELVNEAYESPRESPSRGVADKATESLLRVGSATAAPIISAYESAMESAREVEAIWRGEIAGIPTGIKKLDEEIGSMRPTDFIVIPGKPGMGKSAIMCSIALRAAMAGFPVKVFSLEMTRRQWVDRNVCDLDYDSRQGPLWYGNVRNGKLNKDELERYVLAARDLHGLEKNYEIDDEPGLTVRQISSRARAFIAKHPGKPCLFVVDYIQKIEPADSHENRERQVAGVAMGLKMLAKRDQCVVVAGSQFNEDDQKRTQSEQRPRAGDVRESKVIVQEADLMISPWRPLVNIINRKPMGASKESPEWNKWLGEYRDAKNTFDLLGLKARHGRQFDLNLYCDMAASAIRDQKPIAASAEDEQAQRAQADMLEGI